jgi:intraflagellar transport protein 172
LYCRATSKAVEAAIGSRQWAKAEQILELQDSEMASRYYKRIGDHYASIAEYEVMIQ